MNRKKIGIILMLVFLPVSLFADNIANLKCYPIPFSPFKDDGMLKISYSLSYYTESEITIRIFTLTGNLIYSKTYPKGSGTVTAGISQGPRNFQIWDGKNSDGRYVADGGYILQIKATPSSGEEEVKYVKILVIKDR